MEPYLVVFVTTESYVPLSADPLVLLDCFITNPPSGSIIYFRGEASVDVPFFPGQFHQFDRISLHKLFVKSGSPGEILTIIGRRN